MSDVETRPGQDARPCPGCGRELRRTSDALTAGGAPAPGTAVDGPRLWCCDHEGATFVEDGDVLAPVGDALYRRGGATNDDHAAHAPGRAGGPQVER